MKQTEVTPVHDIHSWNWQSPYMRPYDVVPRTLSRRSLLGPRHYLLESATHLRSGPWLQIHDAESLQPRQTLAIGGCWSGIHSLRPPLFVLMRSKPRQCGNGGVAAFLDFDGSSADTTKTDSGCNRYFPPRGSTARCMPRSDASTAATRTERVPSGGASGAKMRCHGRMVSIIILIPANAPSI